MTQTLVAGDRVKWMRLYRGGWETTYYGTVVEIEVGAEIPCAIVQPKRKGEPVQRVEVCSLLRAEDSRKPEPNEMDLLLRRDGQLSELPMHLRPPWVTRGYVVRVEAV